jgi:hypothetical protein
VPKWLKLQIRSLAPTVAQMRAHIERVRKVNGIEINYERTLAQATDRLRYGFARSDRPAPMPSPCKRSATS